MEWYIVYAKFDGCKGFRAFDVKEGILVGNLIYASLMENTEGTRAKLQRLADLNKESPAEKKREGLFSDQVNKVTGSLTNCPQLF